MSYDGLSQALASVTRLAKTILPDQFQIQTDVKHALAKSSSLFILNLTLAAEQFRQTTKRSTISADDVLRALQEVEFQELVPALELQLSLIRKSASEKRMKLRKRQTEKNANASAGSDMGGDNENDDDGADVEAEASEQQGEGEREAQNEDDGGDDEAAQQQTESEQMNITGSVKRPSSTQADSKRKRVKTSTDTLAEDDAETNSELHRDENDVSKSTSNSQEQDGEDDPLDNMFISSNDQ